MEKKQMVKPIKTYKAFADAVHKDFIGWEKIDYLLRDKSLNPNLCNSNKTPIIVEAIKANRLDLVQALIDNGAELNVWDEDYNTPLLYALFESNFQIAELLVSNAANVKARDEGNTLMHLYIMGVDSLDYDQRVIQWLISKGLSINDCNDFGMTILHHLAIRDDINIMKQVIPLGLDINALTKDLESPVYLAAMNDSADTIVYLAGLGANLRTPNKHNYSPLHIAAMQNSCNAIKVLVEWGVEVDIADNGHAFTPLMSATLANPACPEAVKLLLSLGANVNIKDRVGLTPLDYAMTYYSGSKEVQSIVRLAGGKTREELETEQKRDIMGGLS